MVNLGLTEGLDGVQIGFRQSLVVSFVVVVVVVVIVVVGAVKQVMLKLVTPKLVMLKLENMGN